MTTGLAVDETQIGWEYGTLLEAISPEAWTEQNGNPNVQSLDTDNHWYLKTNLIVNQLELHEYNSTVDTVRSYIRMEDDRIDY